MVKQRVETWEINEESSQAMALGAHEEAVSGESMKLVKHTIVMAALILLVIASVLGDLDWGA